jgi:hypothetical protein
VTDKNDLAEFIRSQPTTVAWELATAILARWRLVPVEPVNEWRVNTECTTCQHRAASELTHHDTDAGHYE